MRISDWSSDVCSSDLHRIGAAEGDVDGIDVIGQRGDDRGEIFIADRHPEAGIERRLAAEPAERLEEAEHLGVGEGVVLRQHRQRAVALLVVDVLAEAGRSEEHTSELQSLMRISYAVFCLKKKNK